MTLFRTGSDDSDASGGQIPFRATADLAAALVRPPEAELPGLRVVAAPLFDTTLESDSEPGGHVELGVVLDRFLRPRRAAHRQPGNVEPAYVRLRGHRGGKSQTVRGLLEALSRCHSGAPVAGDRAGQSRVRAHGGTP